MREMVKWNIIPAVVYMMAFDLIPALRDGKSDAGAIISFIQDVDMFKRFKRWYNVADDKQEQLDLIEKFNAFMDLREAEDYISHGDSKNRNDYKVLF